MTHAIGSLFSGYGGLDLAVDMVLDAEPVWFVEFDDAPSKILNRHWPGVPNHGDVTKVDWSALPPVDILTGGYPCQPFSAAGRRKGTDDERHLWPYVRDAIRVLRPRIVFLENVAGHRSLGFDQVLGDLAEDGADVWWTSLRASDIGAPHHRERLFILVVPADSDVVGSQAGHERPVGSGTEVPVTDGGRRALPDPLGTRRSERRGTTPGEASGGRPHGESHGRGDGVHWGEYAPAIRRWERTLGRPAPSPTEPNTKGNPRLKAAFAEWMMGLPAGWVADTPGLSRADQLKAIGNGVCPPQAAAALLQLLEIMDEQEMVTSHDPR